MNLIMKVRTCRYAGISDVSDNLPLIYVFTFFYAERTHMRIARIHTVLVAGLCRIFRQDGYRVAPFKSQNMALNSFITTEGLEMGRAQVMQAEAAGIEPSVRMNPILLKPTSDVGSQVIVNGEVRQNMRAAVYFKYKKSLIPDIMAAYNSLAAENDIIVVEGAGSPAEINLKSE